MKTKMNEQMNSVIDCERLFLEFFNLWPSFLEMKRLKITDQSILIENA